VRFAVLMAVYIKITIPEHGGSRFFRNVGTHLSNYTVSHPRTPQSGVGKLKIKGKLTPVLN
jgi:hypothetical protein